MKQAKNTTLSEHLQKQTEITHCWNIYKNKLKIPHCRNIYKNKQKIPNRWNIYKNKMKIPHCRNIYKKQTENTTLSEHLQIVKRGKIDNSIMHIHDHSLSWLGTDTPITSA